MEVLLGGQPGMGKGGGEYQQGACRRKQQGKEENQ